MNSHLQNNWSKMDWRCGQGIECLLCEHKDLSLKPQSHQNKTKQNKKNPKTNQQEKQKT
jgi:hypothetical protein